MPDKKLIKGLKAKIEAIVIAIPREIEAHEYYMEMAAQYEDRASREMFEFLAKQEMAHRDSLEKILIDLEKQLEKARAG